MSTLSRGKPLLVPLVIAGLGAMTVASAQTTSSPFAKKAKKQAWETEAPSVPAPTSSPGTSPEASSPYSGAVDVEIYDAPASNPLQDSARRQINESAASPEAPLYNYQPRSESPYAAPKTIDGEGLAGAAPKAPISSSEPY